MSKRIFLSYSILVILFAYGSRAAHAATVMNLRHSPLPTLFSTTQSKIFSMKANPTITLEKISQYTDSADITHTRYQQTYQGIPVWGGYAITHQPTNMSQTRIKTVLQSTANGTVFQDLNRDLLNSSHSVYQPNTIDQTVNQTISAYQQKTGSTIMTSPVIKKLIYVDKQKAHWALQIQFESQDNKSLPHQPVIIINMETGAIDRQWDNLKTEFLNAAIATGFGGNQNTGRYRYGIEYPALHIKRDRKTKTCYLKNRDVVVQDMRQNGLEYQFHCTSFKKLGGPLYYDDGEDPANGAYSPSNDALYAGRIIQTLYKKWYGVNALTQPDGKPMQLVMRVHFGQAYENAYWDGRTMTFGDGGNDLYPLVSIDVAAHEISHGFTEQHANLEYHDQSGALNESFSDMAAQAAEYFSEKNNHWTIGDKIMKNGGAIRYMDIPSKDMKSIGNINEYDALLKRINQTTQDENNRQSMIVHLASGVYNRFFYLLATSPNFDVHKAFDIVVKANQDYWTPTTDFKEAACALLDAQAILNTQHPIYHPQPVESALKEIGFNDLSICHKK